MSLVNSPVNVGGDRAGKSPAGPCSACCPAAKTA